MEKKSEQLEIMAEVSNSINFIKEQSSSLLIFLVPILINSGLYLMVSGSLKSLTVSFLYFVIAGSMTVLFYGAFVIFSVAQRTGKPLTLEDAFKEALRKLPQIVFVSLKVIFFSTFASFFFFIPYFYVQTSYWLSFVIVATEDKDSWDAMASSKNMASSEFMKILFLNILAFAYVCFSMWILYPFKGTSGFSAGALGLQIWSGLLGYFWLQMKISVYLKLRSTPTTPKRIQLGRKKRSNGKKVLILVGLVPFFLMSSCALMIGVSSLLKTKAGGEIYERMLASAPVQDLAVTENVMIKRPKHWSLTTENIENGVEMSKPLSAPPIKLRIWGDSLGKDKKQLLQAWLDDSKAQLVRLKNDAGDILTSTMDKLIAEFPKVSGCEWSESSTLERHGRVWTVDACKFKGKRYQKTPLIIFATTPHLDSKIVILEAYTKEGPPKQWLEKLDPVLLSLDFKTGK